MPKTAPVDADAQAFLTAAGITDPIISSSINTLVVQLKADNIWTKMKALYPFVGGTAATHKFNLKDPRDLDAAFRLVFNGGWDHSANGATPNGVNGYADTNLLPNVIGQNSSHASIYSRTNNTSLINRVELGSAITAGNDYNLVIRWDATLGNLSRINSAYFVGSTGYIATKTSGLFSISRTSNTLVKKYEDGIIKETNNVASLAPNSYPIYIGSRNNSGTASFFDFKQYAFASIGDGLTDTESANLYTAVQAFQTSLNRQV
jgi:hypothetical protein